MAEIQMIDLYAPYTGPAKSIKFLNSNVSPNGSIASDRGTLCFRTDAGNIQLWINTDGNTTWSQFLDSVTTDQPWEGGAGTPVTLRTTTDQVAAGGTAQANRKFSITTTGTNQGLSIVGLASSDNAIDVKVSGESAARLQVLATGGLYWGSGSATADISFVRSSAGTLTVDNNASGGIIIVPAVTNTGVIGTDALKFAQVRATIITSGDHIFQDRITNKEVWAIHEDEEFLYFKSLSKQEDVMKIDYNGNLYLKGTVLNWKD